MISEQLQDLLDVVFGSPEKPSVNHILTLACLGEQDSTEVLAELVQLMWLERNDLEAFNKWVLENL